VFRIKSKGRQRQKTFEKTFVSLELIMFIQPPLAFGWDIIYLRIADAIVKT